MMLLKRSGRAESACEIKNKNLIKEAEIEILRRIFFYSSILGNIRDI